MKAMWGEPMAFFKWNESYSVHVRMCDAQHQKLIEIINQLADAMQVGKGAAVIRETLAQLLRYTQVHFAQEEELMKRAGYPNLAAHQQLHRKLVADIQKFHQDLEQGGRTNIVAVLDFLKHWLVDHIQKNDKAYSGHLNACGID